MHTLTLEELNAASAEAFAALLRGIYEDSPWVADWAEPRRPFASLAQLKRVLVETVAGASHERRLALLRAHPKLAGQAMLAKTLTAESTHEQGKAGLTRLLDRGAGDAAPAQRRLQRKVRLPLRPRRARPARRRPREGTDHRDLRPPPREPPRLRIRGSAAQRPPDRRAAPRRPLRLRAAARPASVGLRRAARPPLRPRLRGARPAHRDLPHRRASRLRRAARSLDARVRLRRGVDRRRRQRRRPLSGAERSGLARSLPCEGQGAAGVGPDSPRRGPGGRPKAAHGEPFRHGAQWRQVRRPARHLRADGLRSRVAPGRPPVCPSRSSSSPSPKRKASATRRPSSAPAPSSASSTRAGSTSPTPKARPCARRCAMPACRPRSTRSPR